LAGQEGWWSRANGGQRGPAAVEAQVEGREMRRK